MRFNEKISRVILDNIGDNENLITVIKENGDVKVMSERILLMIEEYELNRKAEAEEEEEEEIPEPPPPPRNAFERFMNFLRGPPPEPEQLRGRPVKIETNQALKAISNLFKTETVDKYHKVERTFMRRDQLYFKFYSGWDEKGEGWWY